MSRDTGTAVFLALIAVALVALVCELRRDPAIRRVRQNRGRLVPDDYPDCGCFPECPGLPVDGMPLNPDEQQAMRAIANAFDRPASPDPDYSRRPRP